MCKFVRHRNLLGIATTIFVAITMVPVRGFADALPVQSQRECQDPTPAETLDEMFAAIYGCWTPPEESAGMGVTLQFILLRDGTLKGKVIVAWVKPQDDSPARQAFVDSAIEAVRRAVPVPLGEALQKTVPGRVLRPKFSGDALQPEQAL